jgi:hypothetical protein
MTTPVKAPGISLGGSSIAFQSLSNSRGIGGGLIGSQTLQQPQQPPPPPHLPPPIAPIGVRPSNYQNGGISVPPPPVGQPPSAAAVAHHKFATAVAQQIGQQLPSSTNQQQRQSPQLSNTQFVPSQATILSQQNFHAISQVFYFIKKF